MKIAFYSTKPYDRRFFDEANAREGAKHEITYLKMHLDTQSAPLAQGHETVCAFVNDALDAEALNILAAVGVKHIAMRCSGYNNVDLKAAEALGILISRVPAYSPHAVAEHTIALLLTVNRNVHRAFNRVREGNFALEGLLGFDLCGLKAGVVGTGKIGIVVAQILNGFGCDVIAYDPFPNEKLKEYGAYVELKTLLSESDIITLHCPLTPDSHHLIDADTIESMKDDVTIINTSRGALLDTPAVIEALKSGKIGHLGLDVYEEEGDLFFEDLSDQVIQDDVFARLTTFPNVVITGHQAFFTREALRNIADTTLANVSEFEKSPMEARECTNRVLG